MARCFCLRIVPYSAGLLFRRKNAAEWMLRKGKMQGCGESEICTKNQTFWDTDKHKKAE